VSRGRNHNICGVSLDYAVEVLEYYRLEKEKVCHDGQAPERRPFFLPRTAFYGSVYINWTQLTNEILHSFV